MTAENNEPDRGWRAPAAEALRLLSERRQLPLEIRFEIEIASTLARAAALKLEALDARVGSLERLVRRARSRRGEGA